MNIMAQTIKKDMTIAEVVMKWPQTAGTFMEWGLHCYGCAVAKYENVEQGAVAHGIDPDKLVEALNEKVEKDEE
jgi:hybrid cluster-associated redox disulfide protein